MGSHSLVQISTYQDFSVNCILMVCFAFVLYQAVIKRAKSNIFLLVLVGMICGAFFSSLSSFMQAVIDPNEFDVLQGKMFASFNSINVNLLTVSISIFAILGTYLFYSNKKLDLLLLGQDNAKSLGMNVDRDIFIFIAIIAVFVAVSTALVGPVTFLGIITTNIAYQIFSTYKHKTLMIANSLIGAIFLLFGQLIIERIFKFEITTSIVINLIGGFYFIYLMLRARQ
jgi:iron complex transport system permease protein